MAKSIITDDKSRCYICKGNGGYWGIDTHHVYGGANRKLSEKYGLKVPLCHTKCHLEGVHNNSSLDHKLKAHVQKKAMERYGWDLSQWIKIFGKNYLD